MAIVTADMFAADSLSEREGNTIYDARWWKCYGLELPQAAQLAIADTNMNSASYQRVAEDNLKV